jgi:hypothetical protein
MAYGKKYEIDYKSMANEGYTLEFWVDGWAGASTEINLGGSGPEIQYETDSQEKFTYILASSLDIPFIVENIGMEDFITDLRDGTFEEQDVYVHLFNSRDTTRPVWSGFIIMDLAAKEDVSFPYEVKLTAIDGLSLLKERPFVRDTNTDTGAAVEFPYNSGDVYWNVYDDIVDWIEIILLKTGSAQTAQGLSTNYTFKTSVNWYNASMPTAGQADDPLRWTQCKMNSLYSKNEDGIFTPKSTYEVLEALCKSWGMRCVYWHHTFHFVQISQYQINESGTTAAPINIPTREYYYNGGVRLDQAYIGTTQLGRYDLQFENVTNVNNAGLQKLAGTQYDYYPTVKKVIGNFSVFEDGNNFNGFPALDQTTGTGIIIKSTPIDTFKDAANGDGWFCQIPLNFSNISSIKLGLLDVQVGFSSPRVLDMTVVFSIRAKQTGAASWDKMLVDIGGTLSWITYDVSVTTFPWITNTQPNIPVGTSQRIIFDSSQYAGGVIPVDAAFTGDWDFEFFTVTKGINSNRTHYHGTLTNPNNSVFPNIARAGTTNTNFGYSNVFNSFNQYTGIFAEVAAGVIGATSIQNQITTNTTDSYSIELNDLYWGDSALTDIQSTLRVWNGSAFVKTSDAGEWGLGTVSGTEDFIVLLAKEVMANQSFSSLRMNVSSALSETDKENSGKLKMVNPVGRLKDVNSEKYVFLSGTFSTLRDEWSGVWFQQTYNLPTVNTLSDEELGPISGPTQGGSAQGNIFGMGAQSMMQPWAATTISTQITAGSITSLPIDELGTAIFVTGDRIFVDDREGSGQRIAFEINADQSAGDTTLTVVAKTIDFDLRVGAIIGIDNENLIQQYQRKTEGTIAGMPVTADSIGKYEYKGGVYSIVGVDPIYVKVLPSDFMTNDDASSPDITPAIFNDGTNTGVSVENTSQELIATVNIPYGTTATEVAVWGSNTSKSVEIYEANIASNGIGSAIGTGTTNGSAISIGTIAATTVNYLVIKVLVSSTNHRIWGGKVTLTQN